MTAPYHRSASAALDDARPAVDRLDLSRDPEDVAAGLIEAWEASQRALQSLSGSSTLRGQPLIHELRQRDLLSLAQAHALVDFAAAAERSQRTDYRPSAADIDSARAGFRQLEAAVTAPPAPRRVSPRFDQMPAAAVASAPPPAPAGSVPTPRGGMDGMRLALIGVITLVVIGALGGLGYALLGPSGSERTLDRAQQAYRSGDKATARSLFAQVARDDPERPLPHIYLGRLAREDGDVGTAARELATAIRLDPKNALAQREMAAHLLSTATAQINQGNTPGALQSLDLARSFYTRAAQYDPTDRTAQGFLGCTLIRLGTLRNDPSQTQLGLRFTTRAGRGDWSACEKLAQAPAVPR